MNWKDRITKIGHSCILLSLVVLLGIIVSFTIMNDCRFNEERCLANGGAIKRDSLLHKQTDCMVVLLQQISNQMDSIRIVQEEYHTFEKRNIDTIKTSLGKIERTERRILNLMK